MNKIYFSKRKYEVFNFIVKYFQKNEYTPTFAEIAKNLGFTRSRANAIVNDLVEIGLIDKETDASQRKIRLSKSQINHLHKLKCNIMYIANEFRK